MRVPLYSWLLLGADIIDDGGVTRKVVDATRSYLELPHFNREIIQNKSKAAAGLCDWAVNIVKYFDVVIDVAPKKAELAEANAKLADANETLEVVMSKVCHLSVAHTCTVTSGSCHTACAGHVLLCLGSQSSITVLSCEVGPGAKGQQ